MNGFGGIGGWELLLIAVIAILVLGPERMIHYAFRTGRFVRKMSVYWQEGADAFRAEMRNVEEAADSDISDIQDIGGTKEIVRDCGLPLNQFDNLLAKSHTYHEKCAKRQDLYFDRVAEKYLDLLDI